MATLTARHRWGSGCHLHGEQCRVPWGYDEQHTDSPRPYTLSELAARTVGPHRYAYRTHDDYLRGWYLWRALRRDALLTTAESEVAYRIRIRPLVERVAAERGCDPDELAEARGLVDA